MMAVEVFHRLIGVVILVLVLARLSNWISLHLQGIAYLVTRSHQVATFFMFLVLAPGIFVHELSHWVMARLLGVQTTGFRVWPKRTRKGQIQLGAVEVRGAGRLSMALIGMAPFIVGTLALVLLGGWLRGAATDMADWRSWVSLSGWRRAYGFFEQGDWPWRFYAMWVISNAMMPSAADREPVRPVVIGLALLVGVAYVVGLVPTIPPNVYANLIAFLDVLGGAFLLAVIGNVFVALFLAVVEYGLGTVLGARVDYG